MSISEEKPLKLLSVEDNPTDASWLIQLVQHASDAIPYSIRTVQRMADAEAVAVSDGADCILLDLSLPDSDGLDSIIRMRKAAPNIPIVVLTGSEEFEQGLDAVEHGAQDYLVKGKVNGNTILRCVRWAIARSAREAVDPTANLPQVIVDSLQVAAAMVDANLRILVANTGFLRALGCGQYAAVGRALSDHWESDDLVVTFNKVKPVLRNEASSHTMAIRVSNGLLTLPYTMTVSGVDIEAEDEAAALVILAPGAPEAR